MISIVIPVFNVENYIDRCVESVIKQSYKNIEILLVDDGSTDNSPQKCDEWAKKDERIVVFHKQNAGLSSARNFGIEKSSGEYIGFVDSDDWISDTMYERLINLIESGNYDIAACGWSRVKGNETEDVAGTKGITEIINYKEYIKKLLKVGTQESDQYAWNKLYRRDILNKDTYPVGLTDEDVEGTFKCVLSSKKDVIRTDEVLYFYRVNHDSITGCNFNEKKFDYLVIADHINQFAFYSGDKDIIEWAKYFRYRASFGVLSRIASMDIDGKALCIYSDKIEELIGDLRSHYLELMIFKWPFSRKIVMTAYCINFRMTCVVAKLFL